MPDSWRHIDISDIVHEQTLLRDSILCVLDESNPDVDPNEVWNITNMMKRSGWGKAKIEHVEEALGDGAIFH